MREGSWDPRQQHGSLWVLAPQARGGSVLLTALATVTVGAAGKTGHLGKKNRAGGRKGFYLEYYDISGFHCSHWFGGSRNPKGRSVCLCICFVTNTREKHSRGFRGVLQTVGVSRAVTASVRRSGSQRSVTLSQNLPHLMASGTSYKRALARKPGRSLARGTEPWAAARAAELVLPAAAAAGLSTTSSCAV